MKIYERYLGDAYGRVEEEMKGFEGEVEVESSFMGFDGGETQHVKREERVKSRLTSFSFRSRFILFFVTPQGLQRLSSLEVFKA